MNMFQISLIRYIWNTFDIFQATKVLSPLNRPNDLVWHYSNLSFVSKEIGLTIFRCDFSLRFFVKKGQVFCT